MQEIRLFLTDVDGCLTDGGMYYSDGGDELKRFCTYDGMGMVMLRKKGIACGILTSETTDIVLNRARKLDLDYLYMGVGRQTGNADIVRYAPARNEPVNLPFCSKLEAVKQICSELKITLEQVSYVGDDINDIDLLMAVGMAACPINACQKVKSIPNIVQLRHAGGDGAIREFCEMILEAIQS